MVNFCEHQNSMINSKLLNYWINGTLYYLYVKETPIPQSLQSVTQSTLYNMQLFCKFYPQFYILDPTFCCTQFIHCCRALTFGALKSFASSCRTLCRQKVMNKHHTLMYYIDVPFFFVHFLLCAIYKSPISCQVFTNKNSISCLGIHMEVKFCSLSAEVRLLLSQR